MPARPASRLAMGICWMLVVFLVLFPKGGIKVGDIPLTWGYMLIGLTFPFLLGVRVLCLPLRYPAQTFVVALLLLPMQVLILYAYLFNGVEDFGMTVSTCVNLFVLPVVFLLVYAPFLPLIDGRRLANYLRFCIVTAAAWGIILFVIHPITGHYIEIPYLTVNAQDYGELENTKHIARGFFFKLISTYNNGNLYGTATLILLPMYRVLEPARWRRAIVMVALFLTLSRSIWFGMIIYELLPAISQLARQYGNFPRVSFRLIRKQLYLLAATVIVVIVVSIYLVPSAPSVVGFLLDPTAGGRISQPTGHETIHLLPAAPLGGFSEIVYLSVLASFGISGFLAFVLFMLSPILVLRMDLTALDSPLRTAALKGLVLYSFVAMSDGGFNYIPVMAFYWFAYMIYNFGWPAFQPKVRCADIAVPQSLSVS